MQNICQNCKHKNDCDDSHLEGVSDCGDYEKRPQHQKEEERKMKVTVTLSTLTEILDYLEVDNEEARHYEESNRPKNHIMRKILALRKEIKDSEHKNI